MKTYKNLWEKFISKENFDLAYKNAIKRKGRQWQVRKFKRKEAENLEKVRQLVIRGEFHTSEYKSKIIYEPKKRVIYKLPFCPDRIVQHAVMNILKPILINLFIENTYACIEGRGQMRVSRKCSEYVRKYKYCLKCDIKSFYPSINQQILSDMYHRIIKDEKFLKVIDDIVFSFPGDHNCPIGNYMSQWSGNFYLTKLDNFVLHELKPGGYERYCDDFMLFSNDKQFLHTCRKRLEEFLWSELELKFSKSDVFNTKQGVDFCGYRTFGKYVLVRKSTAKRMKRRFRKVLDSDIEDVEKLTGQVASCKGWLKHACSHHLYKSLRLDDIDLKIQEFEKGEEI